PGTGRSGRFLFMGPFHAKQSIRERVGDEPRSQLPEQAHIDMLHELIAPRVSHMREFMLSETT
ncbi:MAG: hypothetical protein KF751_16310, partial [Nitrospira sp.]|nr:hypothetical protein [Nitrospira sp.]